MPRTVVSVTRSQGNDRTIGRVFWNTSDTLLGSCPLAGASAGWRTSGLRRRGGATKVPIEKGYAIRFDRDISQCVPQASFDRMGGGASEILVGPDSEDPNTVVVEPLDEKGNHVLRPFYLAVFCP